MPGVPPNALSKLKQAFKGMLKSKKRQDQNQLTQPTQSDQTNQQDEQLDSASSKPGIAPKLPPTHPLATGQHAEPQVAVPKPGVTSASHAVPESAAKEQSQTQREDEMQTSPAGPAPVAKDEATKSDPVSALSSDHEKPLPLPTTDGATGESKSTASTSHLQSATNENVKPNGTATFTTTAPNTQPTARTSSESSHALDEKMPVMAEEPPEIKTKAAAPGMSATSGPLDDFPMGGDKP